MEELRKKNGEINALEDQISQLKGDLEMYKNNFKKLTVSESELKHKVNRQQTELERLRKENASWMKILDDQKGEISKLTDLTAKKVKTSRSNVTNFLEEKTKFEEERAATDQHLRAYKRQVDNLRQQLDDKTSNNTTSNDYEAKIHEMRVQFESEKRSLTQKYQLVLAAAEEKRMQYEQENIRIKQENTMLQRELTTSNHHYQNLQAQFAQQQNRIKQNIPSHTGPPYSYPVDQYSTPPWGDSNTDECTRTTDEALRELDEMKQNIRSSPIDHHQLPSNEYTDGSRNRPRNTADYYTPQSNMDQGLLVNHPGHHHRDNNDDDDGSGYDPNLICPRCHVQYRFGEIQKLRRHINEYCTGSADY